MRTDINTSTVSSSIRVVSDDYKVVGTTMVIEEVRGMKAEVEVTAGVEPRRFKTAPCFKARFSSFRFRFGAS